MTTVDRLALISGTKPRILMKDGDEIQMSSYTTDNTWSIKRISNYYTCSCPGWNGRTSTSIESKSCRHLENLLGFKYEQARLSIAPTLQPSTPKAATNTPNPKKRTRAVSISSDEDEDEDDGPSKPTSSKSSKSTTTSPNKRAKRTVNDKPTSTSSSKNSVPSNIQVSVLLAKAWKDSQDPKGYWMSEKLDGVRAYFTNSAFYSRLGNRFFAPDEFAEDWIDELPKGATLDGELFTKRNAFSQTVSIVKSGNSPRWGEVTYMVFDAPFMETKSFEERFAWLTKTFGEPDQPKYSNIRVVEHEKCKGKDHLEERLEQVQKKGGEGLMLRLPGSKYEHSRSSTLLKVKTFYDAEARVIAHHKGSGKNATVCGAIEVEMECGTRFRIGSGFTDAQRRHPPKKGAIVVYRFQELSKSGMPRFPTFVGEAIDKTEPKDAVIRSVDDDEDDE